MGGPQFRTRPDGTRYPLTGKKSGAATTLGAAALVGSIALGSGGGAGLSGTATDVLSGAMRAKVSKGKIEARKGQQSKAFGRLRLKSLRSRAERALDCALNSYGDVQQFFLRHPCRELDRLTVPVADGTGKSMLVAVYWVRMSSSGSARKLRSLADTDGTGNVTPLGGVGPRVGSVAFTGEYYDSKRRRTLVTIAEAAPLEGSPDDELLEAATQVAVELPPR
jgi:hypothetical protein